MGIRKSLITRRKNLEKARKCTQRNINKIMKRFVLSIICCGFTFSKMVQYKKMMNEIIPIEKPSKFYYIQKLISPIILSAARKNIIKNQKQMSENTVISFDGSWDHRRDGKFCIVEAFDTKNKKIIDFEIVAKKTMKNSEGTFEGASNQMEIECVKKIVKRLKGNSKIIGYVHDQDSKLSKFMEENWNIKEYIDPNHANKSFNNKFDSYKQGNKKDVKKGVLNGVQKSLTKYRNILIKSNFSEEEKISLWFNAIEHYKGNHKFCIHEPYNNKEEEYKDLPKWARNINNEKLNALRIFLNDTVKYINKVNLTYNTQLNEAFHSLKSEIAPKTISWVKSYHARMAVAVLRFNEPNCYFHILESALELSSSIGSMSLSFYYGIEWIKIKRIKSNAQKRRNKLKRRQQRAIQIKNDKNVNSGYDFTHGKI